MMHYFILCFREYDTATKLKVYERIINDDDQLEQWFNEQLTLGGVPIDCLFRYAYMTELASLNTSDDDCYTYFRKRISWNVGKDYSPE